MSIAGVTGKLVETLEENKRLKTFIDTSLDKYEELNKRNYELEKALKAIRIKASYRDGNRVTLIAGLNKIYQIAKEITKEEVW